MKKNIISMLLFLQLCVFFMPLPASANVENINKQDWQYRWGDSPFNENGIPTWTLNNTDDESNWLHLKNINSLEKKQANSVWYKLNLKNIACERNCSIKVSRIYQNYDVYLDNTRIHNFGEMDHSDIVKVEGRSLGQINFDKGNSRYIYFRVHSSLARIGLQGNIIIGEQAEVTREIVKANVLYFSITIISLIVGLILMVMSFLNRTKLSLIVGIFIFSMGEYIFTLSDIKFILFPNHELLLYNLKIISEYVLSGLTFITYESFWGAGYKKINNIIWKLFMLQAFVYIIVAIGDVTQAQNLFIYYNFSVLVSFIYLFVDALFKYLKYKNFEVKMILFAIFSITAACIHDVLRAILLFNANQIMPWGLCSYMIFMCVIIIKRIYNIHIELQKSNIRLDELNKQKDRIFANTSHELRTPLTGIIGLAESLLSESNEKMKTSLNIIISSGRRLSKLINDILDISNMNNNATILELRAVNVFEVAESVIFLSKPLIGNKPVTLVNRITSTLVLADEDRLQQIFHNLLSNAIKFTDSGVIELSIQLDGDYATILIKDKGIGIPIDKLEDIFLPFEQVDGSISRKYGGTGLGLFVTKQLVELHGGTLVVESKLGEGTTFSFDISLIKGAIMEDTTPNIELQQVNIDYLPALADLQATESKINILIVDDEILNLQVLYNFLTPYYGVTVTMNGCEALKALESVKYDLVLLDIMIPEMNGFEVCSIIRESYSIYELPVILISAYSTAEYIANGFKAGANEYITKPFIKQEILTRVDAQLKLKVINEESNKLSEKEKDILRLHFNGKKRAEIRDDLFISESTLKNHITRINKKLNSKTIHEAVEIAKKGSLL